MAVGGLRDAVGVQVEPVPRFQLQGVLPIADPLHAGQHKARAAFEPFKGPSSPLQQGRVVARVYIDELAGADLQHAHPPGHEQSGVIALAQLFVGLGEHRARRLLILGVVFDEGLGNHHKQRRGHPLAGYVGDNHRQVVVVHQEEVVEVAAHLLGRVHGGIHVEFLPLREGRENSGQHVRLDLGGHIQLGADALLLRRDGGQVLDVLVDLQLHGFDGLREGLDLVAGADVQLGNGRTLLPIFSGGDSAHPCGGGAPLTGAAVGHVLQSGTGHLIDGVDYKPVHQQHQDHAGGDHGKQNGKKNNPQKVHPVRHHVVHGDVHVHKRISVAGLVVHPDQCSTKPAKFLRLTDKYYIIACFNVQIRNFFLWRLDHRVCIHDVIQRVSFLEASPARRDCNIDIQCRVIRLHQPAKNISLLIIIFVFFHCFCIMLHLFRIQHGNRTFRQV